MSSSTSRPARPTIVYWGQSLGPDLDPASIGASLDRPIVNGTFDVVAPITVVPEHGSGFVGRPGLTGRRGGGRAWAPRFTTTSHAVVGNRLVVGAADDIAGLALQTTISLAETLARVGRGHEHRRAGGTPSTASR